MDFLPISVLILILYVSSSEAIHCFQCSFNDIGCDVLKFNDTNSPYYQECKPSPHGSPILCRKIRVKIMDPDIPWRVYRSCGYMTNREELQESYCVESDSDFKKERSCECTGDGCNSSPPAATSAPATAIRIVMTVAAAAFTHKRFA